ncbi:hypothetical protein HYY72_04670 [Candidatus Woesearchaeota archaeon]|nr:hypothetical protein [Candidatus Woesearchaeota archaeon]
MSTDFFLDILWPGIIKKFGKKPQADFQKVFINSKTWTQFLGLHYGLKKEESERAAIRLVQNGYPIEIVSRGYLIRAYSIAPKVKNLVKKRNLYFTIFDTIRAGKGPINICNRLEITKQTLNPYMKNIKRLGIVKKIGRSVWCLEESFSNKSNEEIYQYLQEKIQENSLSKKILSVGARRGLNKANLHALHIKAPILEGASNFKAGYESKLKGWNRGFLKFPELGITLANNNGKSISIYLWSREIYDPLEVPALCNRWVHAVCSLLKKEGIIIDYFGWQVKTLHIMIRQEELDKILSKGLKIEVALERTTQKISENDVPKEAKVWVDSSPYKGVETNDL